MFSNGKSIAVWPVQRDELFQNTIDCRVVDVQQKINDLLSAGYVIYDVASATNAAFNNLIASSCANRICIWKSAGSTAYTLYSTELASNGTNVIINANLNNMNLVTSIRDCKLTCTASSGLFANKAEFYGGDWYLASWTTGSNVKFTNCDVYAYSSEIYMPDCRFDYCNVYFKKSGTLAYSTYKQNLDTRFVNMTTAGSTQSLLTLNYAYTTDSDWLLRTTFVDWQNTGALTLVSTASARTFNFTGVKIQDSDLTVSNLYTTEGNKIYYEGQNLTLSGSNTAQAWSQMGTLNISASSGAFPSMAVDQNGIPYVAFQDNNASDKASCYKYGSTGWTVVGYAGFSSNAMDYINLCISTDNDVVVVGRDNSSKASAYYLSAAASSWNLLQAGFSTNLASKTKASIANTYKKLTVLVSNTSGPAYLDLYSQTVGTTSAFSLVSYSTLVGISTSYNNLAIDIDMHPNNGEYTLIYFLTINSSNNNVNSYYYDPSVPGWGVIGLNISTGTTISKISSYLNGFIYNIVNIDESSKITSYTYSTSSPWNKIGSAQFSTGTAQNLSMTLINSVPHVAIQDTTAKATVYKYVSANSSWNLVGSANFSTDNVTTMSLASFNGTPYLAVAETGVAQGIAAYTFGETVTNSNINYSFENLDTDVFDGEYTLDITNIQSTANFITQNCNVRPGYNIVDTAVGRFIRNTYQIDLNPRWNPTVNETLKETNADTFWVIDRTDIEATLSGKIVKNLKLYNADLSAYTYNSNDNFIIIANNAQKGNAVFAYYNNKVRATIFSDQYLDVSYTITDCIQILEVNEISDLQNLVSSTAYSGGPLESGSITFNSYDNEVVV